MRKLLLAVLLSLFAASASAQAVVNPAVAKIDFSSADHTALVPAGEVNAGQPKVTSYQGMVFNFVDDPAVGNPIIIGPVVPKSAVGVGITAPFRLTYAQMGLTSIPACTATTQAACPQYSVVIVAIGPGGTTARASLSESDPFQLAAAALLPTAKPAAPTQLKVVQ